MYLSVFFRIFIIILFVVSCASLKNKDEYRKFTINELKESREDLKRKCNYMVVEHFLYQVENFDHSYMPLTKVKNNEVQAYWESIPKLKKFYDIWRAESKILTDFQDKHDTRFRELGVELKKGNIELQDYYKKHRMLAARMRKKFPDVYQNLILNHVEAQTNMWLESGKYMLSEYKKNNEDILIDWVPEKSINTLLINKDYKALNIEIDKIDTEINNRLGK